MARVEGIGGLFIDSENARQLARWYQDILGIQMIEDEGGEAYFTVFYTRDVAQHFVRENPVFAIRQVPGPLPKSGRGFVLNLRVDNLDDMLAYLQTHDIAIDENRIEWERGKHAWIHDADGNRIELYEELLPAAWD